MTQEIETIKETFQFESQNQFSDFCNMADEFAAKQLINELNSEK